MEVVWAGDKDRRWWFGETAQCGVGGHWRKAEAVCPFSAEACVGAESPIAEQVDSPVTSWTFHSLLQGVQGGQYERFDNLMFLEDMERKRLARRGTSRARSRTPGRRSRSVQEM